MQEKRKRIYRLYFYLNNFVVFKVFIKKYFLKIMYRGIIQLKVDN